MFAWQCFAPNMARQPPEHVWGDPEGEVLMTHVNHMLRAHTPHGPSDTHMHPCMHTTSLQALPTHVASLNGRPRDEGLSAICQDKGSVVNGDRQVVATAQEGWQHSAVPEGAQCLQQEQADCKSAAGLCA